MPTALILDAHSRAGLETLQSLGRHGVKADIASSRPDCLAFRSRYAQHRLTQPTSPGQLVAWLSALEPDAYDLIVPSTELSLDAMRQLDESDPRRIRAVIAANQSLDVALDKEATQKFATGLGIVTPATSLIPQHGEIRDWHVYPIVLKPVRSKFDIDGDMVTEAPCIASSAQERSKYLGRLLPYTAIQQQEYVGGIGFGVDVLYSKGNPLWKFVHERVHEYPLTGGGSSYRRSVPPFDALLQPALKLMSALRWHGVAMVEFKWDGQNTPCLMEINPRLWGSLALSIDAGVDFPLGLLQVATGQPPSQQAKYQTGYYTRDLLTDLEWQKENLRANRSDPLLFTRSRTGTLLELLRPVYGKESWDHFDLGDLGVTWAITKNIGRRWGERMFRFARRKAKDRWLLNRAQSKLKQLSREKGQIRKILLVCYGNICRSPLAEQIVRKLMPDMTVTSAGFHRKTGRKSPTNVLEAARQLGVDLTSHSSKLIDTKMVSEAQLILVMDSENLAAMERCFPDAMERCLPLGIFQLVPQLDIEDPYGKSANDTTRVAALIMEAVSGLGSWLGLDQEQLDHRHCGRVGLIV